MDDNSPIAVGKVSEFGRFAGEFDEFIMAIGNPVVRHSCVEKLTGTFKLATIVHPLAYVSSEASVGSGCVIEPGCVVYRNVVLGESCLINAGAVLNHDCAVEAYCQIGCNAVVAARAVVPEGTKVMHGEVVE